jgi:hypothetical protein
MQDKTSKPADSTAGTAGDPGFRVPDASAPAAGAAGGTASGTQSGALDSNANGAANGGASGTGNGSAQMEVTPMAGAPASDTSTRDIAIGTVVFLVLLAVYFFVRNSYVHHMIVKRVAPSAAGNAGWLMFVGLSFASAAAVLAVVNPGKFLNWAITGPLVLLGVVALVSALFVGRR